MKSSVRFVSMVAILAASVSACGADEEPSASDSSDSITTLNVALFPIPQLLPLWAGMDEGCFEKEGLKIEPQIVTNSLIDGLQGGTFDLAYAGYPPPLQAIEQGIDLKLVAEADRGVEGVTGIYVPGDSDIQTVDDLAGKTVATLRVDLWKWYTQKALEEEGADFPAVEPVVVPFESTLSSLQRGTVDAALITEPRITEAKQTLDAREVIDLYDQESTRGLGDAGYFATSQWVEDHPDELQGFLRGFACGVAAVGADPAGMAEALLPKYANIPAEVASEVKLAEFPAETDPDEIQRVIDLMTELDLLQEPMQASDIIATP